MRAIAIVASYNEERFIGACIEHLIAHGCEVYLCDNDSTDNTRAIAETFLGRGLVGIETIPRGGVYRWRMILDRKAELAATLDADWFMHVDADEFRLPPPGKSTLIEALAEVDAEGYNAVNFIEFVFLPTQESPDHDHPDFQQTMRSYYPFIPRPRHRVNGWKRQRRRVDLSGSAGHRVEFRRQRLYPTPFRMRHYLFLSVPHAIEKYVGKEFDETELEQGWHRWRSQITPEKIVLPRAAELREYTSDDELDLSDPWTHRWIERWTDSA